MKKLSKYQNIRFESHLLKGDMKLLVDTISKEDYLERRGERSGWDMYRESRRKKSE